MYGAGFDELVNLQNAAGGVAWYGTYRQGTVRHVFDNATGTSLNTVYFDAFGTAIANGTLDRPAINFETVNEIGRVGLSDT